MMCVSCWPFSADDFRDRKLSKPMLVAENNLHKQQWICRAFQLQEAMMGRKDSD